MAYAESEPLIVFGAFDRHNFGDMLFAHFAARLIGEARPQRNIVFAGLASRDLRDVGGHEVLAVSSLAAQWRDARVDIVHAGGELLTCDAWEAAVMLQSPADASACIARYDRHDRHDARTQDRAAFAHAVLGTRARAPYVIGRETFARVASIGLNALGGVSLDACDDALRAEVLTKLRDADALSVRDLETRAILHAHGIASRLCPDPVTLIAALFGERIRAHADKGAVLAVRRAYPNGYLAVQFSADFGDDATHAELAHQLESIDMGIALFRAGAAPWHDDIDVYARIASRLKHARVFESLNVWDICALIASSAGFAGSSLHGRIVSMAYALPRVNLLHCTANPRASKQSAYAQTWDMDGMPGAVSIGHLANALDDAFAMDRQALKSHADTLTETCRAGLALWLDALT